MAYDSNYLENRFTPPRINLQVKEWDYDELIGHLARVLGRPFKVGMAEDILEQLKRLELTGWPAIVDTVESMMLMGKNQLGNNLWSILLSSVNSHLQKKDDVKQRLWFIPEWERSYELITIQAKIIEEMLLWIRYSRMVKTLYYNGKPVVWNEDGFSTTTAEKYMSKEDYKRFVLGELPFEAYFKYYKKEGSWCTLMDTYLNIIQKSILKEYDQNSPDNNAMKDISLRFLNHLISERLKQTGIKNEKTNKDGTPS